MFKQTILRQMVQWLSSPESLQTLGDNDHDAAAADDDADDDDDEDEDDDDDEDDDMMTGMITMVGFARRWGCPWNPPRGARTLLELDGDDSDFL